MIVNLAISTTAFGQSNTLPDEPKRDATKPIYSGEVELGVGVVTEDSFKFGEYNGLEDKGPFVIGNINFQQRSQFDGGDATFLTLRGTDLGLNSRSIQFEYGQRDLFSFHLGFNQIPKFTIEDASTPYLVSDHGTRLTLPTGWVPGDRDTSELTELSDSLRDLNLKQTRERYSGGFSLLPAKNWTITTNYTRELRDGSRTMAAIFGINGGNPAGAVVPEPIDYTTDAFDLSFGYTGKKTRFVASYNLSLFDNNSRSVTFDNIFTSPAWEPAASFPDGIGAVGLAPDNQAHHLRLTGQYLVSTTTRATANMSWSRMTQDQSFLDFTANPNLLAATPLPRTSLNGEINTLRADLAITMRPAPKLNVKASYRYEDRDNDTPRDIYLLVHNDSGNQGTIDSSAARINVPYSRTRHLFEVDTGYRLTRNMKIQGSYEYEHLSRNFSDVSKTREHRVNGKLRYSPTQNLQSWVDLSYTNRDGSTYDDNAHFVASHTLDYLGPDPDAEFENHPLIRKFYLADKSQIKIRGSANWLATEKLIMGFTGRYSLDDYDNTILGLTESSGYSVTIDGSYAVSDTFNANGWVTFDQRSFEQSGLSSLPWTDLFDFPGFGWSVDTDDRSTAIGLSLEWKAIKDRLDIILDGNFLQTSSSSDFQAGPLLSFAPLPDVTTNLFDIGLKADYQCTDALTLRLRYMYQHLRINDYAHDGVAPDTLANVLGFGNQAPNHDVHVIGLSTIRKF